MNCIATFLFSAAALCAADFTTGQAARLVIGQSTFTSQDPNSSDTILGGASGLAYAADTLFVADSNRVGASPSNHRVILYQNLSGMVPQPTDSLTYNSKCPVCVGHATLVLGQPDFTTTTENLAATPTTLRLPTAVASDGVHVVVADTDHNRVLIWNRIPSTNDAPADVVVGQPNFTTNSLPGNTPNAKSMRGPQGVWIQNGRLYVADTQNNRVLIFNRIPTSNGAAADIVLGQPDMTTFVEPDLTQQKNNVTANQLLNPVSVTSDGVHVFVTDLGYNRVLIWNSIPSTNGAAADVAVGQPDMVSSVANNAFSTDPNDTTNKQTPVLCKVSNGTDTNSNPTYPASCNSTLSFPRYALAAGNRLFIADGGNDRVLGFNTIPTQNGASADIVIGQLGGSVNQASDAADSLRTPMSLAWDGTNLYVSDAYNRRITVYSIGENTVPYAGVVNSGSLNIIAKGNITFTASIASTVTTAPIPPPTTQAGDVIDVNIGGTSTTTTTGSSTTTTTITGGADYKYTVAANDTVSNIITTLSNSINAANGGAGDTNVYATPDLATGVLLLTSRLSGISGNATTIFCTITPVSTATTAGVTGTTSGATLSGGGDAASLAPGTIAQVQGTNLSFHTVSADLTQPQLPTSLGGTQVYFNGIPAPLVMVSPTAINAQIPWELGDTTSINAYVRSVSDDGSVMVTTPVAVSIVTANPGIYARPNSNPSAGLVYHASSSATGIVSVDGTATASDTATVTIEDRSYTYTVQSGDTLTGIRDALVNLINQDPKVKAAPSGEFQRIILTARVQGPEGNDLPYTASASSSATVIMTAIGSSLCCAAVANSPVTTENPAVPGELIYVYATGLGVPVLNDGNKDLIQTGVQYPAGGPVTTPASFVNSIAGGKTADVISATLMPGAVGLFQVLLHLNPDLPTDPYSQLTIAQDIYVSNVVTLPIVAGDGSAVPLPNAVGSGVVASDAISFTIGPPPLTASNALVNAANPSGGNAVAPGTIASLYGANLAPQVAIPDLGPTLPLTLGGVTMTMGGASVPLFFVSPTQVNFQIPLFALAGQASTTLTVTQGSSKSTFTVLLKPYAPALFTTNEGGTGQASTLIAGTASLAAPNGAFPGARPAKIGEYISIYATGLGDVSNRPGLGSASPVNPLATTLAAPSVTIGGVPAAVTFSGLAPGYVGLYQVNVQVPAGAPTGPDIPIVLTIGGVRSNTATIAVDPATSL
jgi:uncharacterized protein (TIGR03437 family)